MSTAYEYAFKMRKHGGADSVPPGNEFVHRRKRKKPNSTTD